tara:strand:- start:78688 stop:79581 length:894 start_codon:yes stop_codon:yes gene_type:complete
MSRDDKTYCGFIAVMGRPNVGKSTLLNGILQKKISITSHKPQTTRRQVLGVKTIGNKQMVWVDTPGIHAQAKKALNKFMNQSARQALIDVNVMVFVVEALRWTEEDEQVLQLLLKQEAPLIIVVNKVDKIKNKSELLPFLEKLHDNAPNAEIIPLSALKGEQIECLEQSILDKMPEDVFYFAKDSNSNQSKSFHMSEIVREKLMRTLEQEVPYSIAVEIEKFEDTDKITHVHALIWVERDAQKGIVVGKGGAQLKKVGTSARLDLEKFLGKKVCLKLWVKVKANWADQASLLETMVG